MKPRPLVVLLISVAVATAGAALPGLGDAGTGGDAGDDPGNATQLQTEGTYHGSLVPPGDADWYVLDTSPTRALCSQAVVDGTVHADVTLSISEGLNPAVTRPVEPAHELDLGLSSPSTTSVFLGLGPPEEPSTSTGTYRFDLRTTDLADTGPGDAGTGGDAGDDRSTGIETEGPCIGGELSESSDSDVYVFEASEGEHVALSLAQATSAPVIVNLTAPSGARLAHVEAGGFTDVVLNETGEWIVRADLPHESLAMDTDYMIGLTVNGPEPQPCNPTCMTVAR